MDTKTLTVPNISCGHCVMAIKRELDEMEGVTKVDGDPGKKEITLEWEKSPWNGTLRPAWIRSNPPSRRSTTQPRTSSES